jgi:hypothetical protein
VVAVDPAQVFLGVELQSELFNEIELSFEEVDMAFLVLHEIFKQVLGHAVADALAISGGLAIEIVDRVVAGEIAFENLA